MSGQDEEMVSRDTVDDLDTAATERRESAIQRRRRQEVKELYDLLQTSGGRAFLWRLLDERCRVHLLSYAGEATHQTAFHEGARNVGNWLLAEIFTADPQAYTIMRHEAEQRAVLWAAMENDDGDE